MRHSMPIHMAKPTTQMCQVALKLLQQIITHQDSPSARKFPHNALILLT